MKQIKNFRDLLWAAAKEANINSYITLFKTNKELRNIVDIAVVQKEILSLENNKFKEDLLKAYFKFR